MTLARHALFAVVLAGVCIGPIFLLPAAAEGLMVLRPGDPAPPFSLATLDGGQVSEATLRGRIALICFWQPGQAYSQRALADLERLYTQYGPRGLLVLAINAGRNAAPEIGSAGSPGQFGFPQALDPGLKAYESFGVIVLPTTVLLDPAGRIVHFWPIHHRAFYGQMTAYVRHLMGEISQEELEAALDPPALPVVPAARKKASRYLNLGRMLMDMGMKDKARQALSQAARADPTFKPPHALLGLLYVELADLKAARAQLELALSQSKGGDPALDEVRTLMASGQEEHALRVLQALAGALPAAGYALGRRYEEQGWRAQALAAYDHALRLLAGY